MVELKNGRTLEDELLLHVAAGTDLPTAIAALLHDERPARAGNWLAWVAFVGAAVGWWLLA